MKVFRVNLDELVALLSCISTAVPEDGKVVGADFDSVKGEVRLMVTSETFTHPAEVVYIENLDLAPVREA